MSNITGQTLIGWGFKPAGWFKEGMARASGLRAAGLGDEAIITALQEYVPAVTPMRTEAAPYAVFLDTETEGERANLAAVRVHMDALMRVPTLVAGAVMPDACPAGSQLGTIPVGGAVSAKDAIHPGFHSADICCSVAMTNFGSFVEPKDVLDVMQAVTHFGPGGRNEILQPPADLMARVALNPYTADLANMALGHFGSQGDGNHFAYVGRLKSTGQVVLVTHHGSRGFGAQLYKKGMAAAKRYTAKIAPEVPSHNAWIKADSAEGQSYWEALQLIRDWTRESHYALHDMVRERVGARVVDRFWNEHNFVFQKSDGLFYHGKGATPSWSGFSADDDGRTLIPLNMAEPILITAHRDRSETLGFAPHGAGRNASRTQYLREKGDLLAAELADLGQRGLDIRSYCGVPDHSELPSAYKNAGAVRAQIDKYELATVVDQIDPYGSIMAGEWDRDAPWKKAKAPAA